MVSLVIERFVNDSGSIQVEKISVGETTLHDIFNSLSYRDETGFNHECWCKVHPTVYKAPELHERVCQEKKSESVGFELL